jgi:predicted nucleic acid-binding protein
LHSELDAGLRTAQGYTVEKAVAGWLDEGLPGRVAKTVEANRDSLRPLLAVIGRIPLKDLTVQDVRTALRRGRPRPANDSWIAACCLAHRFPLATFNVKDFEDFTEHDGLQLVYA